MFHRSETNGITERAVGRVKEGTSATLLQIGLDEKKWADSKGCFCYLRNFEELSSGTKTPYDLRFGALFSEPLTLFGSIVECHPMSSKVQSRPHQFGKKRSYQAS